MGRSSAYPSSTKLFIEWYRTLTNSTPSYQTVGAWGAFDMLESALYRAASAYLKSERPQAGIAFTSTDILGALVMSQMRTPFGRIVFDANGVNTAAPAIAVQVLPSSSTAEIIAPSDVQTASFVYPMPTWDERVYKWSLLGGTQKSVSIMVAVICSFILLVFILTVYAHQKGIVPFSMISSYLSSVCVLQSMTYECCTTFISSLCALLLSLCAGAWRYCGSPMLRKLNAMDIFGWYISQEASLFI